MAVKETVTFSLIRIVTICETQNSDQILTRIWPLLTRLTDDSLLLLHTDKVYTNRGSPAFPKSSFLTFKLSFLLPFPWYHFAFEFFCIQRCWCDYNFFIFWKKYENQFCINHLYTRKLDVFLSFCPFFLLDDFLTFSSLTLIKLEEQPKNRLNVQLSQEIQVE